MTIQTLVEWWNLIFVLPFMGALLYTLLLATGTVAGDHDADVDHDIDHDFDHGVEQSVGHDHHFEHTEPGTLLKSLTFLGFGKVPISILLTSFLYIWGVTGWIVNTLFYATFLPPGIFIWLSLVAAGASSVFLTRYIAVGLGKIMPSTESYGVPDQELGGRAGTVSFGVTDSQGLVQVYDQYGQMHTVEARILTGEKSIPLNTRVVLEMYDPEQKAFIVAPENMLEWREHVERLEERRS